MVTDKVPIGPLQPPTLANTEYTPVAKVEALVMLGFCKVDVKEFGPLQLYVAPDMVPAVKLNV